MISSKPVSTNAPINTIIGVMKGPKRGRNWFDTTNDPAYRIKQTGDGVVKLQGTNSLVLRASDDLSLNPVERNLLPAANASWSDIATSSANSTVTGTFNTQYEFLQLVITTQGTTGVINSAWVRFN